MTKQQLIEAIEEHLDRIEDRMNEKNKDMHDYWEGKMSAFSVALEWANQLKES